MQSILDFRDDRYEELMAWAKYLHLADMHRQNFYAWYDVDNNINDNECSWKFLALMSAWYASLWVVIEGWKKSDFSDPVIDDLLDSCPKYKNLLRRYRNGVFHYQPRIIERRILNLLDEGDGVVLWIYNLHEEFCHFFWRLIDRAPITSPLKKEIRRDIIAIVGWIPTHIPQAKIQSFRNTIKRARLLVQENGDTTEQAAREFLDAASHADAIAKETERKIERWKANMFNRIMQEAQD